MKPETTSNQLSSQEAEFKQMDVDHEPQKDEIENAEEEFVEVSLQPVLNDDLNIWCRPFIEFLTQKKLPNDSKLKMKIL